MKLKTLAIVVCAVILGACSSSGARPTAASSQGPASTTTTTQPTTTTTTPPLGAPLPDSLLGRWYSNIDDADVAVIQQHAPLFDAPGVFTMVLTATTFTLVSPTKYSSTIPIGLNAANQINLAPDTSCPDQTSQDGGLYAFEADGQTLTLTPVRDDSCPGRQWLLIVQPWRRKL